MSSFFDDASLVMIPSGYKDQKVYSVKPIDGSGDFTFSRGSDIEATRVASNGYIEKAKVNLFLQSNSFDTTWTNFNTTDTGGQSGYDGTNDAWLLQNTAASGSIRQTISASGVQTYSFYAKAGTTDWVAAYVQTSGSIPYCFFDLTNGVKGATQNNVIDSSITDVGGGWYRIALAFNATTTDVRIFPAEANAVLASQVGDNIYIQDAQLNYGLVAQDYVETTTTSVVSGITNDMPRLDYSGGASCPSLLLEPSRTNIQTNSEYVNAYVKSRSTVTTNATTSPEGVMNASKVIPLSTSTGWAGVNAPNHSFTSGNTYTLSVFAKAGEYNYCQVGGSTPAFNGSFATINLTNGVVEHQSAITATTEDYGNGWWRISFSHTAISTASSPIGFFAVYSTAVSSRLATQVGDNISGVYMYGWQAELGSYPTSYIPTYGTAANRAADDLSSYNLPQFNDNSSFSIFYELNRKGVDNSEITYFARYRSVASLAMFNLWVDWPTAQIRFRDERNANATMATIPFVGGTTKKIAVVCNGTTFKTFVDGVLINTYTLVNTFAIDKNKFDSKNLDFKQYLEFPTALTDAEAIALTTI